LEVEISAQEEQRARLMQELSAAREPHGQVYDITWRVERLLRYIWFLDHGAHAPFNLIGSWTVADLEVELQLWKSVETQAARGEDPIPRLLEHVAARYEIDIGDALQRGADPELAKRGMPIWDGQVHVLLPQRLGPWQISRCDRNEPAAPGLGSRYGYSHEHVPSLLSLYLYNAGEKGVLPGVLDERVVPQHHNARRDLEIASDGARFEWLVDAEPMGVPSPSGTTLDAIVSVARRQVEGQPPTIESVSVCGFRGGFMKLRVSMPDGFSETEAGAADLAKCNEALAEFVEQFGP
jgi:hypothetical protein